MWASAKIPSVSLEICQVSRLDSVESWRRQTSAPLVLGLGDTVISRLAALGCMELEAHPNDG